MISECVSHEWPLNEKEAVIFTDSYNGLMCKCRVTQYRVGRLRKPWFCFGDTFANIFNVCVLNLSYIILPKVARGVVLKMTDCKSLALLLGKVGPTCAGGWH